MATEVDVSALKGYVKPPARKERLPELDKARLLPRLRNRALR